jgi:hypothetical protein
MEVGLPDKCPSLATKGHLPDSYPFGAGSNSPATTILNRLTIRDVTNKLREGNALAPVPSNYFFVQARC